MEYDSLCGEHIFVFITIIQYLKIRIYKIEECHLEEKIWH